MEWLLIKFIEDQVVLENKQGERVNMPHSLLPADYNIGEKFTINFAKTDQDLPDDQEAKNIINSILKTE